jgi:hypothetical protein
MRRERYSKFLYPHQGDTRAKHHAHSLSVIHTEIDPW